MAPRNTPYELALQVQDACNLSGVVHAWASVLEELWQEARERGEGTDYVNTHPVSVLFADKVASLTRLQSDNTGLVYSRAYRACRERVAA